MPLLSRGHPDARSGADDAGQFYEHEETREVVALVKAAVDEVQRKGEAAFGDFRVVDGPWRRDETYIFVLDRHGTMLVHPDPTMEGKNELELKDINGKPIIRGLIGAVTTVAGKREGWYHYQWPVPGGLLPRWKSTYVELVTTPAGTDYIVGSGIYNDRMERAFVVDAVADAVGHLEKYGEAAFPLFYDPTGSFIAKDAYVFVFDMNGIEMVNPAFRNLEGRDLLDVQDTEGKHLVREMLEVVQARGAGWVEYMWPKPGESISTQKSAYVSRAKMGTKWVLVGCGVYLVDAPKAVPVAAKMTAPELMTLVREAAAVFEQHGDKAYPEFRTMGSKWFHDETYFFALTMDGTDVFHAADPAREGRNDIGLKDVLGRAFVKMSLEAAAGPSSEGWVHYMYPEPGNIFPAWKSTFVKRVTFPSGIPHAIGCGIYNMQMEKAFIEDVVGRAATLVTKQGTGAFAQLRDKTGPFVFMDTYVFVHTLDGTELVNPAQPSLEGRNLMELRDLRGKAVVQEQTAAAMKFGSAWMECYWFKPGDNTPARKDTYVRKVQSGPQTYIVGSGVYMA